MQKALAGAEGVKMSVKSFMKKCMWIMLVILMSFLMIQAGQAASKNIWVNGAPTFQYYAALSWEILKGIAGIFPAWLLSILGLARSCFGENWLPFAEKIPVRVTKMILAAAMILLIGVTATGVVYPECTGDSHAMQYRMEHIVEGLQNILAWVLFYGILLYTEQWCIQRNCSRQNIRKKQVWITVTAFLTYLIVFFLGGVDLWYIPLDYVDSLNRLEDYLLWWFSLYMAVFFLPPWFFAARKTVRLFKNEQWLIISTTIPTKMTAVSAFVFSGMTVWQIQEYRSCISRLPFSEVPEHTEAMATGHTFQAMIWGLALFHMLCLLVKQIRAARRACREI